MSLFQNTNFEAYEFLRCLLNLVAFAHIPLLLFFALQKEYSWNILVYCMICRNSRHHDLNNRTCYNTNNYYLNHLQLNNLNLYFQNKKTLFRNICKCSPLA